MKRLVWLAAGMLILGVLGCASPEKRRTSMPDLGHPGSACTQEKRALRYYPYPEPNVGPGMVETRPREYEQPPAEASRARWTRYKLSDYPNPERWNTYGTE